MKDNKAWKTVSIGRQSLQISSILTETQRSYYIARYHDYKAVSAIAERYGVSRQTVNQTLRRADDNLRANGIIPPPDKQDAGTVQKCNAPTRRVVNLGYIDEIAG